MRTPAEVRMTRRIVRCLSAVAVILSSTSCGWVSLASSALTYENIQPGETGNIVVLDSLAYATLADSGMRIVDARSGRTVASMAPPSGCESIDDVAVSDGLLFALDARKPGHLCVFSLRDRARPRPVGGPLEVPVGPFSGISAQAGVVAVSGGTSQLTLWRYDTTGVHGPPATIDVGRGQPDVLLARHGRVAFVSTHYWGPYFGLDLVRYDARGRVLSHLASVDLPRAGFTAGGAKPANFPIESAQIDDSTMVVAHAGGLAVMSVGDVMAPTLVTTIDVGGPAVNVDAFDRSIAVVVAARPAVIVLLEAIPNPHIVRRIPLAPGTNPTAVALSERTLIVAARNQGILVFER
jgi:hypothetical protein